MPCGFVSRGRGDDLSIALSAVATFARAKGGMMSPTISRTLGQGSGSTSVEIGGRPHYGFVRWSTVVGRGGGESLLHPHFEHGFDPFDSILEGFALNGVAHALGESAQMKHTFVT
jgi:hypothetical protein